QATRGEWHDERDRPGRVVLRLRSRGPNCADEKGAEQAQSQTIHHMPFLSMQITSMNRDGHKRRRAIPEPRLSSQPFRFRKWLIVSRGALLRLDLHHLSSLPATKIAAYCFRPAYSPLLFLALNRRQTTYRFVVPTSRGVGSDAAASRIWVGSLR